MIIRLNGATFSTNIGTLDSWSIKYTVTNGSVTKKSGATSIKKDDADGEILVFEFDTAKYTYKSGTIMSNGVSAGTISVSGNTITVNVNAGTTLGGKVEINFVMEAVGGEEPDTPTNYIFTINPDPTSATVTLSATGYSTVSGTGSKSITVANGTTVNWSVSADGYTTRTGNWTANGENKTESIVLIAAGDSGERVTIAEKDDYNIDGFCRPTNGTFGGTDGTYKRTDYINITTYSTLYANVQPRAASVSPISFFDTDKTWISGITPSGDLTQQQEFMAEVPENAVYAIFSGFSASSPMKAEGILK